MQNAELKCKIIGICDGHYKRKIKTKTVDKY